MKTISGVPFEKGNKAKVFKYNLYVRYEIDRVLLESLTTEHCIKRNSMFEQIFNNISKEKNFIDSQRGNNSTRDRTVIQRYVYNELVVTDK